MNVTVYPCGCTIMPDRPVLLCPQAQQRLNPTERSGHDPHDSLQGEFTALVEWVMQHYRMNRDQALELLAGQ